MSTHAIVLAAGKGTRMDSDLAKVLHLAAGRSLLDWSLSSLSTTDLASIAVVVGHQADDVTASIADHELAPLIATALQQEQLGTGHAAAVGLGALQVASDETVIVMSGDMPLLRPETVAAMSHQHRADRVGATVVTAVVDDPTGYGRVKRDGRRVIGIVEEADASPREAAINEVNTSVYAFQAGRLYEQLGNLGTANAQGEQYLTDVIGMLTAAGDPVAGFTIDAIEAMGVNTVEQLAAVSGELQRRASV